MDCSLPGSSIHGIFPGKNTGVDCHFLLQRIFPTRRLNLGLPHCRQMLYHLSHQVILAVRGCLSYKVMKRLKTHPTQTRAIVLKGKSCSPLFNILQEFLICLRKRSKILLMFWKGPLWSSPNHLFSDTSTSCSWDSLRSSAILIIYI